MNPAAHPVTAGDIGIAGEAGGVAAFRRAVVPVFGAVAVCRQRDRITNVAVVRPRGFADVPAGSGIILLTAPLSVIIGRTGAGFVMRAFVIVTDIASDLRIIASCVRINGSVTITLAFPAADFGPEGTGISAGRGGIDKVGVAAAVIDFAVIRTRLVKQSGGAGRDVKSIAGTIVFGRVDILNVKRFVKDLSAVPDNKMYGGEFIRERGEGRPVERKIGLQALN